MTETPTNLQVEATGETVGEAKWSALRELEKLQPELDKAAVRFQVVSEGERGLLGVGYTPARVIATVDAGASPEALESEAHPEDSDLASQVRELLETITQALRIRCRIELREDEASLVASCSGPELGLLIGKHGQTIDAVQYLVNAIVFRGKYEDRKALIVDAAGYRARREATLTALAERSAGRVLETGRPVELEPMTAIERKVVHEHLKERPGVETTSEGTEPNRFVVVLPAS